MARVQSDYALALGQFHQAATHRQRAIALARRRRLTSVAGNITANQAVADAVRANCGSVRKQARAALVLDREAGTVGAAARALAFCGETAEALSLADELARKFPTDTLVNAVNVPSIRTVVEIRRNHAAKAIELLKAAAPYERANTWIPYLRGLAYLQAKSAAEAAAEFQKILDHKGANYGQLYPLAFVGLARAAALAGDTDKSRKAYQDFLALWKDADPDTPVLKEARQEYAKLK